MVIATHVNVEPFTGPILDAHLLICCVCAGLCPVLDFLLSRYVELTEPTNLPKSLSWSQHSCCLWTELTQRLSSSFQSMS